MRVQNKLLAPLHAQRAALTSRIPNFWPLVLEASPPELDQYIHPEDSRLFAEALLSINVRRFELDESPRSLEITMTFKKDNEWLEDEVLTKKFYFRRAGLDWTGLVSEPVQIRWKKGRDVTNGLTDMAYKLFQARKEKGLLGKGDWSASSLTGLKEYRDLAKKLEGNDPSQFSFFTLFGFVSESRWVSAEESAEWNKKYYEAQEQKIPKGHEVNELSDDQLDQDVEICPQGDDMATFIADDIFPNAIKYFGKNSRRPILLSQYVRAHDPIWQHIATQMRSNEFKMDEMRALLTGPAVSAQEQDEDIDIDMEDDEQSDSEEEEEIDIRALVGKGKAKRAKEEKSSVSPPPKLRKT